MIYYGCGGNIITISGNIEWTATRAIVSHPHPHPHRRSLLFHGQWLTDSAQSTDIMLSCLYIQLLRSHNIITTIGQIWLSRNKRILIILWTMVQSALPIKYGIDTESLEQDSSITTKESIISFENKTLYSCSNTATHINARIDKVLLSWWRWQPQWRDEQWHTSGSYSNNRLFWRNSRGKETDMANVRS